MDHREGKRPESMKPQPGHTPPKADQPKNGIPLDPPRPGPPPEISADAGAEEQTGFFTSTNVVILGLMACLVFFLLFKFTFNELWAILKAVLGLSFVIFIHELGHFLAAKWCGVNVTTFSIGFGPAIPGCQFTWGETNYKLAILPLGGYVQMVGQIDGDESSDGSEDDPRSYRRKTVGQRMLIISAGVIMNAILAACCFIAIYQGPGKEHNAAVISMVDAASPAFQRGLKSGAAITKIDTLEKPTFSDFTQRVINSMAGNRIEVTYQTYSKAGVQTSTTAIEPRMDTAGGKPVIGVVPPHKPQFVPKRDLQEGPYLAGTPAADAKFEYGDVIIAMTDPDHPERVTELPDDPRHPGHGQRDYFEFARRLQLLANREITLRVQRQTEDRTTEVDVKVAPMYRTDLGVRMQMGPVMAVREGSPADEIVFPPRAPQPDKKLKGDVIDAVSVEDADGKLLVFTDTDRDRTFLQGIAGGWMTNLVEFKPLDPERLPFALRQWSDRLDRAKFAGKRVVTLHLSRHSSESGPDTIKVQRKLEWDTNWRFDRAAPFSADAPMPIPELGLAYEIKAIVIAKTNKDSPLQVGDVVKNVRYDVAGFREESPWLRNAIYSIAPFLQRADDTDIKIPFMKKDLKEGQWANISFELFQQPYKFKKLIFKVERDKEIKEIEMPLSIDETWPLVDRGWRLARDTRRVTASNTFAAIWMGTVDTKNRMVEIFENLRGMILGRISVDNLGGPLTIAFATYRFAGMDFTEFAFFIGLISINLAVVNFLPIPVLDGGHMVFLIYEKIRGKPASEGVRIGATYVGLAVILCLMIFVLYLDAKRLFF